MFIDRKSRHQRHLFTPLCYKDLIYYEPKSTKNSPNAVAVVPLLSYLTLGSPMDGSMPDLLLLHLLPSSCPTMIGPCNKSIQPMNTNLLF